MSRVSEAIQRYERGEATTRIGRDFGVAAETIRVWLKKAGIARRSRSERSRKYQYRHDAFEKMEPLTAYWAGLLMADGSISRDGLVSLEIHNKDRELVEGLAKFIEYTGPLAIRTRRHKSGKTSKMISLRVTAPDLAKQLARWGVVPRKTYKAKSVKLHGVEEHYYRGLFDGDGCVHKRKSGKPYANIAGNPIVIDGFRDWCWRTFREPGSLVRERRFHIVQFGGRSALKLGQALYDAPGPRLKRKETLMRRCLKKQKK